jgi:hypothetical protein
MIEVGRRICVAACVAIMSLMPFGAIAASCFEANQSAKTRIDPL